jgi:thiamine-phosphate pyrophosphorylase
VNSTVVIPCLYPILDSAFLPPPGDARGALLTAWVRGLADAGVAILQYRNKQGTEAEILADAQAIRLAAGSRVKLILNDWPTLAVQADFDGVHVGQQDISPHEARDIVGPHRVVGFSTHNEAQLRAADLELVDYIAVGPVFSTASKENPDPVIGLDGVRLARRITRKPLVAIGGITLATAAQVRGAGADSIAVISAIFRRDAGPGGDPGKLAKDFLRIFG